MRALNCGLLLTLTRAEPQYPCWAGTTSVQKMMSEAKVHRKVSWRLELEIFKLDNEDCIAIG